MRIIIIDDNTRDIDHLASILSDAGHQIVGTAKDGDIGTEVIRTAYPDVVFLDLVMDPMNGTEVIRTIRGENNPVPIFLCTCEGSLEVVMLGMKLGASGYLVKPCRKDMVLSALDRLQRIDGRMTQ